MLGRCVGANYLAVSRRYDPCHRGEEGSEKVICGLGGEKIMSAGRIPG